MPPRKRERPRPDRGGLMATKSGVDWRVSAERKTPWAAPQQGGLFAARSRHHRPLALMSFAIVGMRSRNQPMFDKARPGGSSPGRAACNAAASLRIGTQRVAVCCSVSGLMRGSRQRVLLLHHAASHHQLVIAALSGAAASSPHTRRPSDHRPSRNVSGTAVSDRDPPIRDYFPKTEKRSDRKQLATAWRH